jgi:hypothetical protein
LGYFINGSRCVKIRLQSVPVIIIMQGCISEFRYSDE